MNIVTNVTEREQIMKASFILVLFVVLTFAHAVDSTCKRAIQVCESKFGIPHKLLLAIAIVESGRKIGGDRLQPWPWTINANGKPYVLQTKAAAIDKAKKLRASGVRSMDLGAMQINSRHHPNAFADFTEAFNIAKNAQYAASLLRSNYENSKSWFKAVADYHSKTPKLGEKYKQKVLKVWQRLLSQHSNSRANPGSVMSSTKTTLKNVDINMVPLNNGGIPVADSARRFIPINNPKVSYSFENKTKAVYKLTSGRKFYKIY